MKEDEAPSQVITNACGRLLHYPSRGGGTTTSRTRMVADKAVAEEAHRERCRC